MATPGRAPAPDQPLAGPPRAESSELRVYRIPGIDFAVPRWAVHILAVLAVLSMGYKLLSGPLKEMINVYELGRQANSDVKEAYNHFSEQPVAAAVTEGTGGKLEAKLYNDGCIAVTWRGALDRSDSHPHFVRMLTKGDHSPAPGPIGALAEPWSDAGTAAVATSSEDYPRMALLFAPPDKNVADPLQGKQANAPSASPVPPLNCPPHRGSFKSWFGETRDCWVQVWRQFQDGCKHYQWYNKCGGYWDANRDGSPRVYWTVCRH